MDPGSLAAAGVDMELSTGGRDALAHADEPEVPLGGLVSGTVRIEADSIVADDELDLSVRPLQGHPEIPGSMEAEPWGGQTYPDFWSMKRSSVESFSPFLNRSKMSSASFFASTSSATSSVTPRLFIQIP